MPIEVITLDTVRHNPDGSVELVIQDDDYGADAVRIPIPVWDTHKDALQDQLWSLMPHGWIPTQNREDTMENYICLHAISAAE